MSNNKVKLQLASTITLAFVLFFLIILMITSCSQGPVVDTSGYELPVEQHMVSLAEPIRLNVDSTVIQLSDYFNDPALVESVEIKADGADAALLNNQAILVLSSSDMPALSSLEVVVDGSPRTLLLKKSKLRKYTFEFDTKGKSYNSVQMKGEMNSWNVNAQELIEENGVYRADLLLEPKQYQYIMVLNGQEALDQNNPESVPNGLGGFNSLLSPFGDVGGDPLHITTTSNDGGNIELNASRDIDNCYLLWQNHLLPTTIDGGQVTFNIPGEAANHERSFIRALAYAGEVISNDVLIPLDKGKVLSSSNDLDRMDKHAMVLYNVFVDRFYNGNPDNDRPLNRPDVHPRADNHGGDIKGATLKVEEGYFDQLGVNTVWISPIVKNVEGAYGQWPDPKTKFSAYHGYWPVSFSKVDDRMGTEEDLRELVEVAHGKNMNVLLDFVANHIHEDHPFYKKHPNVATDLYLPDGRLNTELWDEQRLTTWFDVFLPSLQLDDPFVYEMLTDSAVYWIKEFDLDGFRHDATKHVPEIFWRTLTRKIKDEVVIPDQREVYQIGETYGTRELVGSYVNAGQLDGQFDFNVYDASVFALAKDDGSFIGINDAVQASMKMFGHHHLMGNITGNQDKGRFISYAGGALRFDENAKKAGWTREVGVGDPVAYKKSALMIALISTIPGLPVIYYGDEVGSYGGNDPDNRKMMFFDDLNEEQANLLDQSRKILTFRKDCLPLIYGDMRLHHVDQDTYVFSRNYFDQQVLVAFNKSVEKKNISIELHEDQSADNMKFEFDGQVENISGKDVSIVLPANSFDIITLN